MCRERKFLILSPSVVLIKLFHLMTLVHAVSRGTVNKNEANTDIVNRSK
jgi:hypothetical protein